MGSESFTATTSIPMFSIEFGKTFVLRKTMILAVEYGVVVYFRVYLKKCPMMIHTFLRGLMVSDIVWTSDQYLNPFDQSASLIPQRSDFPFPFRTKTWMLRVPCL
jgi:hypothetical protein